MPDGTMKKKSGTGRRLEQFGIRYNVWKITQEIGNTIDHPAVFPVVIAKDHIRSRSNEGDVVLDPFMGSGTTGVACKETKRDFIGIEISKKYFEIAKDRIENTPYQMNLLEDYV